MEEYLIQKTYYEETFMREFSGENPAKLLGQLFFAEQKKELSDLNSIRFAQGEIYYQFQDFESAIFKWENIHNELEPWAKKNMADAYFELELLDTAEDIYLSIKTDSLVLNSEITLQLFGLYLAQGKLQEADQMIKNGVILNPDYPNVTNLARAFFEKQQDWNSAVELAVRESIRTESPEWFETLSGYVDKGYTSMYEPAYFIESMAVLASVDPYQFERSAVGLWSSYQHEKSYLEWLQEINRLVESLEEIPDWSILPKFYKEAYLELISGSYYISEIADIVPSLLEVWLKITDSRNAFFASAAVLAWNDHFPGRISTQVVENAETILSNTSSNSDILHESLEFFHLIKDWADEQKIEIDERYDWIIRQIADVGTQHVLIGGSEESGKELFVSSVLGENDINTIPISGSTLFKADSQTSIHAVTKTGVVPVSTQQDFDHIVGNPNMILDVALTNQFMAENKMAIIYLHDFNWSEEEVNELPYLTRLADSLLFLLNPKAPFTNHERLLLMKMKEQMPELRVDFILNLRDTNNAEQEALELLYETKQRINIYFPDAELLAYSPEQDRSNQLDVMSEFSKGGVADARIAKILFFIKSTITHLLQQQIKAENELSEAIQRDEDVLTKLQGSIHQLHDIEEEKIRVIQEAYLSIKEEIKADLLKTIPTLIKDSTEIIKEDSDFRKIHLELNAEMNERVSSYLNKTVLPIYINSLQDWITFSKSELSESQERMTEWEEGFNVLLGEERMNLVCDFQIFDDWNRDADRMTSTIQIDKENILLRRTPTQVLLKGAGKLFGALPKNNAVLANTYKNFIQNENYLEASESIAEKFFRQFELFEKAIGRDIHIFFREPFSVLKNTLGEIHEETETNKAALAEIKTNPEAFRDPLTVFEVRLRQYEWMNYAEQPIGSHYKN
ncbi:tetratricopeptide repeat protein [Lederbergia citrea]|uniref:tetratricopeptide repeat protein n=1 Tax=Lederbergia citrea TaxID=2833581 RepID=UPI001BC90213|nr:GTP-binding protein [Lederbergia citrea]MBS4179333.1 GTP-binding protein [Lederbergia citrea]